MSSVSESHSDSEYNTTMVRITTKGESGVRILTNAETLLTAFP